MLDGNLDQFIAACEKRCRDQMPWYLAAAAAGGSIPVPGVGEGGAGALCLVAARAFIREFGLTSDSFPSSEWALIAAKAGVALTARVGAMVAAGASAGYAADAASAALVWVPPLAITLNCVAGAALGYYTARSVLNMVIDKLSTLTRDMYSAMMRQYQGERDALQRVQALLDEDA